MEKPVDFLNGDEQFFAVSYMPQAGNPLDHLIMSAKKMVEWLERYKKQEIVFVTKGCGYRDHMIGFTAKTYGIEVKKNENGEIWTEKDNLIFELRQKEIEIKALKKEIEERNK